MEENIVKSICGGTTLEFTSKWDEIKNVYTITKQFLVRLCGFLDLSSENWAQNFDSRKLKPKFNLKFRKLNSNLSTLY